MATSPEALLFHDLNRTDHVVVIVSARKKS